MIQFIILKKILLSLAPLIIFYLLRKIGKKESKRKFHLTDFSKEKIVEGEIVNEEDGNR